MARPRLAPWAVALACVSAGGAQCVDDPLFQEGRPCDADRDCGGHLVCLLGTCVDPTGHNLGKVDMEVTPLADTNLLPQVFSGRDTSRPARETLVLRPTWNTPVKVCFRCNLAEPGAVGGDLKLVGPTRVQGHDLVANVVVDGSGMGRAQLLEETSYDPVLFPAAPEAPILRGRQVFASSRLVQGALEVEFPDPLDVFTLAGRVVADAQAPAPVGVDGIKVWVVQGASRLTRDVVTAGGGTFSLKVPRASGSGLTVRTCPASALDPWPCVDVEGVNLDGDRELAPVDLGITSTVTVRGVVLGPSAQPVAGATVRWEGQAGRGVVKSTVVAGPDGTFELMLPPGTYARATIPPPGTGVALRQEDGVRVTGPGPDAGVDLPVSLLPQAQLCGNVWGPSGGGVGSAAVVATRVGNNGDQAGPARDVSSEARTVTDGQGAYCVALDPGRYLLAATPRQDSNLPRRTDLVNVGQQDTRHDVELPSAAVLVGTVQGPDGTPLKTARVRAYSPVLGTSRGALELGEVFTDADGTYVLPVPDLAGLGTR